MKIEKLLKSALPQRSSGSGTTVFALITGLAVGAVLSILFAQESGKDVRKKLLDAGRKLAGLESQDDAENDDHQDNVPHEVVAKKPKSDIKSLIHEAHVSASSSEA